MSFRALFVLALCVPACDHSEPPKGPPSASGNLVGNGSARPQKRLARPRRGADAARPPDALDAAPSADTGAPSPDAGEAGATADAGPTALVPPELRGPDGKPLPQTEAEPSQKSPWFEAGVQALFRAIKADDPAIAEPFFFPLAAYEQVKDVKEPRRDWERRLLAHFRRDVHDYHERLGPNPKEARFVGIELPKDKTKWMKPRSEGNKLGYFRVTRSRLRYETAKGSPATLEVTSLISWRGEWYLVHLNGFE